MQYTYVNTLTLTSNPGVIIITVLVKKIILFILARVFHKLILDLSNVNIMTMRYEWYNFVFVYEKI